MSSTQFSIRLPNTQKDFLDSLAGATNSNRNHLISSAIGKMMENYQYIMGQIEKSEADIAAGRTYTMDEVARSGKAIIDQYRNK